MRVHINLQAHEHWSLVIESVRWPCGSRGAEYGAINQGRAIRILPYVCTSIYIYSCVQIGGPSARAVKQGRETAARPSCRRRRRGIHSTGKHRRRYSNSTLDARCESPTDPVSLRNTPAQDVARSPTTQNTPVEDFTHNARAQRTQKIPPADFKYSKNTPR